MAFGMILRGAVPVLLRLMLGAIGLPQETLQSAPQRDPAKKAWEILHNGARASNFEKRADAVQALGLTSGDPAAVQVAEAALQDKEADVRAAAVKALGAMGSTASTPKLENLLSDKDISVVLAAAHSLVQLKNKY